MNRFLFDKIIEYMRFKKAKIKFKESHCIDMPLLSIEIYDHEENFIEEFKVSETDVKIMKTAIKFENLEDAVIK